MSNKKSFAAKVAGRAMKSKSAKRLLIGAAVGLGMTAMAQAGTTGSEFQEAYEMMTDWINGFLGRAIAIAFLIIGLFLGIARQNLMAMGVSIAAAFGLVIAPTVLDNILSATVSAETVQLDAVQVEAALK